MAAFGPNALMTRMSPGVVPPRDTLPTVWVPVNGQPEPDVQVPPAPLPGVGATVCWKNQKAMLALPLLLKRSDPK